MTREVRFAAVSGCVDRDGKILMSQPAKLQEPTMEEILASIRRIIAEDDLRPPPPPPASPAPAETAPVPAAAESAPQHEWVDGFDDPEVSDVAANDVFEQRESPWRGDEGVAGAADTTRDPAAEDADLDAPEPAASLDPPRFAATQPEPAVESARSEPARDLPSRESPRQPRFEPLRSEVAKADSRSDIARPDLPRPELPKPELPKFELPRREAPRWEAARPDSHDAMRSESVTPEPAKPPAAAASALRAAEDGLLSPRTTAAVDLAFNTLAQTVLVQNSRTLEDLVREMLKPMLRAWLDDNLPGLVERLVRAEIERVSRGRS
jgi:uncharacterized protein